MNIPIISKLIISVIFIFSFTLQERAIFYTDNFSKEIGKKIYTTGVGSEKSPIKANISGRDLPGSMMACANCHGDCGKGLTLQGVIIPDIRRMYLVDRYMKDLEIPISENVINSKLKKAIALGVKDDGEIIHKMMPRYKMSLEDMNHLLTYLAVLGEEANCGND